MPASEDFTPLDTLKRYLDYRPLGNDPWTNTMRGTPAAPGQGFATAADPVLYPTASPLVNITEGDIKRATEVGLAASGGGLKGQQIKAYHSSPHDFDRFDLSRIGTGEGAQVYGHGLYFAENPAVSGKGGQYWQQFSGRFHGPEREALDELFRHGMDPEKALAATQRNMADKQALLEGRGLSIMDRARYADQLAKSEAKAAYLSSDKPFGPRTYEVNINADPAHMLDWDKPLSQQPRKAMDVLGMKNTAEYDLADLRNMLRMETSAKDLREAGIPGIKYLDQGSRGPSQQIDMLRKQLEKPGWRPETRAEIQSKLDELLKQPPPSSNYVIFDPSKIDIRKKYGLAGLLPVGVGAGVAAAEWFPPNPPNQK